MKPIPTTYEGVKYRSRVEARWAVFFAEMEWTATYEQEGFDLNGVWYLPDFWLKDFGIFVEIKSESPTAEEITKCELLATASGKRVWLLAGSPGAYNMHEFPGNETAPQNEFMDCRRCDRPVIFYRRLVDGWENYGWREIGARCGDVSCGDREPVMRKVGIATRRAQNERFGVHE